VPNSIIAISGIKIRKVLAKRHTKNPYKLQEIIAPALLNIEKIMMNNISRTIDTFVIISGLGI